MSILSRWVRRLGVARLTTHLMALWLLVRHPATPRLPRWLAWGVLAYALSPIDLIPDFILVLGQLDDLLLIPLGVALVVRLAPPALWQACVAQAQARTDRLPRLWWGALAVLTLWFALVLGLLAGLLWAAGVSW